MVGFCSRSARAVFVRALLTGVAFAPVAALAAPEDVVAVADPVAAPEEEQEIVVRGSRPIAESEAAALELQRNSPALVSVIAADAAGRLPDQNVAQAISRLPGVGVERDQGQAR